MGIKVRDETEYGNDCGCLCDDGTPFFPPGKTPRYVVMNLGDTGLACSGKFILEQDEMDSCQWVYLEVPFGIECNWSPCWGLPPKTMFRCSFWGQGQFGQLGDYDPCTVCVNNGIGTGAGCVTFMPALTKICKTMGFEPSADVKFEPFAVDDVYQVIRIANKKTSTNQHFLIKCVDFYHPPP